MKLLLILLAKIFNSLPKTDFILVHWCRLYESYGLESPNLVGMNDAPTVTSTSPATNIATTTVTASGNITATGGENPSTRGVCYVAGTGTPTTANTVNSESGSFGTGAFSRNVTGLADNTLYTFRAFATNSVGTGYGASVQFTTLDNTPPTVALNSPADASSDSDTTPTLDFTGTDAQGDSIEYNVQVDTVNTFDSQGGTPAIVDNNNKWSNDANAFDGSTSTRASILSASGNTGSTNWLKGRGTNAPSSGGSITSVTARIHNTKDNTSPIVAEMYTENEGELLATITDNTGTTGTNNWSDFVALSTPSGGWTWAKLQLLEARVYRTTNTSQNNYGFSRVEILVNSSDTYYFDASHNDTAPLLDKLSVTPDAGFVNPDTGGDTHPFNSGENIQYTVQAGDALAPDTYYWRVRGLDPSGSNTYGAWSDTRSFEVTGGGAPATRRYSLTTLGVS